MGGKEKENYPEMYRNCRSPDEAVQYMNCNSRENVWKNVSNQSATNNICDYISCDFCKEYFEFYYPGVKYRVGNNGHFNFLKGGKQINKEFYSSFRNICGNEVDVEIKQQSCKNTSVFEQIENGGYSDERGINDEKRIEHFDYVFDSNNLKSLQEIKHKKPNDVRQFLLGEGFNKKILEKFDNTFDSINIKLSTPKFVFRNTNVLINRVYKALKTNQHLRDITYRKFGEFIKDFILICNKTFSIKFLEYCIEHDIIPYKFRRNIDIEDKFRTKIIRNDCKNLSKDLMREAIKQTRGGNKKLN